MEKLLATILSELVSLIFKAIQGDTRSYERVEAILSPQSKLRLAKLRAAEVRKKKFSPKET